MWFLIKGTFWFTLVLVALSFIGGPQNAQSTATSQFQLSNAISAATGAYDYVSGLCTTKPDVCAKGAQTFSAIGERAREGALVAFQLLNRHFGDGSTTPSDGTPVTDKEASNAADHVVTGTVSQPSASQVGASQAGPSNPLVINVPRPRVKPAD
ncbi:DUF5330 domain-containing protein [Allorhizobium terrae]|uniref:DUF5330 domain-containing protein n=1 Tax=Allorhizobium terrae TaxID=1848972 RepID=A0A4S3ZPY0_9HYPH|nr:DUF5330 domain-containing protein [Allorhizobium terrae]THF47585.1 hypothetical protein E6C51_17885 [Allorhizobium terrae]